jgi:hypothetical protein
MRARVLSCYHFRYSSILTLARVQCVAHEHAIIYEFFEKILYLTRDARQDGLFQLMGLRPVDDGH